jgi:hypothetical protein
MIPRLLFQTSVSLKRPKERRVRRANSAEVLFSLLSPIYNQLIDLACVITR